MEFFSPFTHHNKIESYYKLFIIFFFPIKTIFFECFNAQRAYLHVFNANESTALNKSRNSVTFFQSSIYLNTSIER